MVLGISSSSGSPCAVLESLSSLDNPDFLSESERDQLRNGQEFLSGPFVSIPQMGADDRLLFDHQKARHVLVQEDGGLAVDSLGGIYRWMQTLSQLNDCYRGFRAPPVRRSRPDLRIIDDDLEVSDSRIRVSPRQRLSENSAICCGFCIAGNDPLAMYRTQYATPAAQRWCH